MSADSAEASGAADPRHVRRDVVRLAAPIIGESLLQTLLGVVDTALVARVGLAALAGVGAAQQVVGIVVALLTALSIGASVLVAQAVGAGQRKRAGQIAREALLWGLIVAVPLTPLGAAGAPALIGAFSLPPDVAAIAGEYLAVTLGGIALILLQTIAGSVLRGAGDSRTPFLVSLLTNAVNLPLSYALIFGAWGLPALGAVGSAWGTLGARAVGAALLLAILIRGQGVVPVRGQGWRLTPSTARAVLGLGLPSAAEEVLLLGSMAALTPIVAGLGTVTLAAHRIVLNTLSLAFLPGIGFAVAATVLVGQRVGAGEPAAARAVAGVALRWGVGWMSAVGALFALLAPQVVAIFVAAGAAEHEALVRVGSAGLIASALAQPGWAACMVLAGALRGAGKARIPLIVSGGLSWLAVGLAWALVQVRPDLASVWAAFVILFPIEAAVLWWLWRRTLDASHPAV